MAIGALPTLADGALPRSLTQEWARAIYEDHPLGAPAAGIRYRSAHNGGIALALWDTAGRIRTLLDHNGTAADIPLTHPGMLIRLKTLLMERQIVIRTIDRGDCPRCTSQGGPVSGRACQHQTARNPLWHRPPKSEVAFGALQCWWPGEVILCCATRCVPHAQ